MMSGLTRNGTSEHNPRNQIPRREQESRKFHFPIQLTTTINTDNTWLIPINSLKVMKPPSPPPPQSPSHTHTHTTYYNFAQPASQPAYPWSLRDLHVSLLVRSFWRFLCSRKLSPPIGGCAGFDGHGETNYANKRRKTLASERGMVPEQKKCPAPFPQIIRLLTIINTRTIPISITGLPCWSYHKFWCVLSFIPSIFLFLYSVFPPFSQPKECPYFWLRIYSEILGLANGQLVLSCIFSEAERITMIFLRMCHFICCAQSLATRLTFMRNRGKTHYPDFTDGLRYCARRFWLIITVLFLDVSADRFPWLPLCKPLGRYMPHKPNNDILLYDNIDLVHVGQETPWSSLS